MNFFWHIVIVIAVSLPNIAAYGTFITLMNTESYLLGMLVGRTAALALSMIFAWCSLRLEQDGFGVISLAMHLGLLVVVLNFQSLTRGALGIPRVPRLPILGMMEQGVALSSMEAFVLLSVLLSVGWIAVVWWIDRGPIGRKLKALSEFHQWAGALGVNRTRVHIIVFALGAVGALLTNVLFHQYLGLVHPNDFSFTAFIFFVTVVVAGGPGSVFGAILACILLVLLREGLRFVPLPADILGPLRLMFFGLILFTAVWWRRDTLFPKQRMV